jgi:2-polyprenyl-3-methyl-5-hydroxy-6-metoxy-1,4-benzoquinol methylase
MDRYSEISETWNRLALLYERKFMHLSLYNETYDYICKSLPGGGSRILDIGCGPGNITGYLLSERPDFKITGIDIAQEMIKLARKNNPSAVFEVMDCRQVSNMEAGFDAVICGFCMPYLAAEDCLKLVEDCRNLLNKPGLLYLSFVEGDPEASGFRTGSDGSRLFIYYHTLAGIRDILSACSFQPLKTYRIGYKRENGEQEMHTVIIASGRSDS